MAFDTNGRPARTEKTKRVDIDKQRDDSAQFDITDEEREEIRAKARNMVAAEIRKQKEASLLDQFLTEERQQHIPSKRLIPIFVQCAGFTNYIMLDGTQFFHDNVYHVTEAQAAVLAEQMARAWAHEEITQVTETKTRRRWAPPPGAGYGNYEGNRNPRNLSIGPNQQGAAAEAILGIACPS